MRAALIAIAGTAALSGCAVSGLDAKSSFSCAAPEGVSCMSLSGVYANSRAGNLPGQQVGVDGSGQAAPAAAAIQRPAMPTPNASAMNPTPAGAPVDPRTMQAPYMGMPVRTAERVLRVWMSPYEDEAGTLNDQRYFYVSVAAGRWQVENTRIAPRSAFRQITPLSTENPANREVAPVRSPAAQAQQMVLPQPPAEVLETETID